ncbi:DNA polymerase III subunit gamma/tau [Thiobacter aerophilum]|uniref:DNA polymerase III subunit gamma/tau n=1 Tax=Thiobacter aerophilum TaxID=3121275 RepID=A0ABV0EG98_9BURK
MPYQVLARKWRPKSFAEMVGQEHVVRALSNALDQQRLHHAYLFTGTRGVGKTTLGRILAKCLNCETGITSKPCGVCAACTEIDRGRFVDMIELDAASNTGIDNMREVLDNAQYAPTVGRFKVYLIDEVHMLSKAAFNSMLKTLEEPPEHVKFILATTDPQKIPVTVLSRCLQFNLKQMSQSAIVGHLERVLCEEGIAFEAPALRLLARAAQGSMRDALSLTDQAIAHGSGRVLEAEVRAMLGVVDQGYLFDLLDALLRREGAALIGVADRMAERSLSFDGALQDLGVLLHQVALAQTTPEALADDLPERERILGLAQTLSPEEVQLHYQIVLLGRRDLHLAPDEYAGFTMTLLRMLAFRPESPGDLAQAPAARAAGVPAQKKTEMPASAAHTPHAVANPARPAAVAATPPAKARAFDGDWIALVERLRLSGMARMLAEHCVLESFEQGVLRLVVPSEHRHLSEKPYQDKLCGALTAHFGEPVKLVITVGAPSGITPAQQQQGERAARQARAVEAIEQDPFVRELVEQFDARVIESSIKPIQ